MPLSDILREQYGGVNNSTLEKDSAASAPPPLQGSLWQIAASSAIRLALIRGLGYGFFILARKSQSVLSYIGPALVPFTRWSNKAELLRLVVDTGFIVGVGSLLLNDGSSFPSSDTPTTTDLRSLQAFVTIAQAALPRSLRSTFALIPTDNDQLRAIVHMRSGNPSILAEARRVGAVRGFVHAFAQGAIKKIFDPDHTPLSWSLLVTSLSFEAAFSCGRRALVEWIFFSSGFLPQRVKLSCMNSPVRWSVMMTLLNVGVNIGLRPLRRLLLDPFVLGVVIQRLHFSPVNALLRKKNQQQEMKDSNDNSSPYSRMKNRTKVFETYEELVQTVFSSSSDGAGDGKGQVVEDNQAVIDLIGGADAVSEYNKQKWFELRAVTRAALETVFRGSMDHDMRVSFLQRYEQLNCYLTAVRLGFVARNNPLPHNRLDGQPIAILAIHSERQADCADCGESLKKAGRGFQFNTCGHIVCVSCILSGPNRRLLRSGVSPSDTAAGGQDAATSYWADFCPKCGMTIEALPKEQLRDKMMNQGALLTKMKELSEDIFCHSEKE